MPTFAVTISATVTKTITVTAENEDEAYEKAHDEFSVLPDPNVSEKYEQETLDIEIVEEDQ